MQVSTSNKALTAVPLLLGGNCQAVKQPIGNIQSTDYFTRTPNFKTQVWIQAILNPDRIYIKMLTVISQKNHRNDSQSFPPYLFEIYRLLNRVSFLIHIYVEDACIITINLKQLLLNSLLWNDQAPNWK